MKKRSKVKIMGQWISLQHVPELTESEGIHGECDTQMRIIRIDSSLEGDQYKRTLRHECQHMKLSLSGLSEMMDPKLEEALCVLAETD